MSTTVFHAVPIGQRMQRTMLLEPVPSRKVVNEFLNRGATQIVPLTTQDQLAQATPRCSAAPVDIILDWLDA
eukprot:8433753-Pyramimonas_sp.AAC.1